MVNVMYMHLSHGVASLTDLSLIFKVPVYETLMYSSLGAIFCCEGAKTAF